MESSVVSRRGFYVDFKTLYINSLLLVFMVIGLTSTVRLFVGGLLRLLLIEEVVQHVLGPMYLGLEVERSSLLHRVGGKVFIVLLPYVHRHNT